MTVGFEMTPFPPFIPGIYKNKSVVIGKVLPGSPHNFFQEIVITLRAAAVKLPIKQKIYPGQFHFTLLSVFVSRTALFKIVEIFPKKELRFRVSCVSQH